jgi:hypothetical protein
MDEKLKLCGYVICLRPYSQGVAELVTELNSTQCLQLILYLLYLDGLKLKENEQLEKTHTLFEKIHKAEYPQDIKSLKNQ